MIYIDCLIISYIIGNVMFNYCVDFEFLTLVNLTDLIINEDIVQGNFHINNVNEIKLSFNDNLISSTVNISNINVNTTNIGNNNINAYDNLIDRLLENYTNSNTLKVNSINDSIIVNKYIFSRNGDRIKLIIENFKQISDLLCDDEIKDKYVECASK